MDDVTVVDIDEPVDASDNSPREPIRGVPKSGRKWKPVESARFSSLKTGNAFRSSWSKKESLRREMAEAKAMARNKKEERQREIDEQKRLRAEREERRKANERKAEIVQVVKNVHKLKRMKKKMLRKIEKRDTTVVEKGE